MSNYHTGGLVDHGASAIAENLTQWKPRMGDGGWPPSQTILGGMASRGTALLLACNEMHRLGLNVQTASVLEVGCGFGDGLRPYLPGGFLPRNMTGIDLDPDRLKIAAERLPGMSFVHGNAADMKTVFADGTFDVVSEQYCFCHIPDDSVKTEIAREMLRVVKPGGFVLIHDWRMKWPARRIYGPSRAAINEFFAVGSSTRVVASIPSLLWPPIGNRVSRWARPVYGLLTVVPPLVGSRIVVLKHVSNQEVQ